MKSEFFPVYKALHSQLMSPLLLSLFIPSHCLLRPISTGLWLICESPQNPPWLLPHSEQKPKSFLQPTRPCYVCLSPPYPLLLLFSPLLTLFQLHRPPYCYSDMPSTSGALYWLFLCLERSCLTSSCGCFFPSVKSQIQLHLFREALPDLVYRPFLV